MKTDVEMIETVIAKMEKDFPGVGDESGQLDWETLVARVIHYLAIELIPG